MKKSPFFVILLLTLSFLLGSCSSPTSTDPTPPSTPGGEVIIPGVTLPTQSGVFLDAKVNGVAYECLPSGIKGVTDSDGFFLFKAGDTITFKIGTVTLGTATAAGVITPLTITGALEIGITGNVNPSAIKASNLIRLLMALDTDGNPDNGISISSIAKSILEDPIKSQTIMNALTGSLAGFSNAVLDLLKAIAAAEKNVDVSTITLTIKTPEEAKDHFDVTRITPVFSINGGAVTTGTKVTLNSLDTDGVTYEVDTGSGFIAYPVGGIDLSGAEGATITVKARGKKASAVSPIQEKTFTVVKLKDLTGLSIVDTAKRTLVLSWSDTGGAAVEISGSNGLGVITTVPSTQKTVELSLKGINIHELTLKTTLGVDKSKGIRFLAPIFPALNMPGTWVLIQNATGTVTGQKFNYGNSLVALTEFTGRDLDGRLAGFNFYPLGLKFGGKMTIKFIYDGITDNIKKADLLLNDVLYMTTAIGYNSEKQVEALTFTKPDASAFFRVAMVYGSNGLTTGTAYQSTSGTEELVGALTLNYSGALISGFQATNAEAVTQASGNLTYDPATLSIKMDFNYPAKFDSIDRQFQMFFRHEEASSRIVIEQFSNPSEPNNQFRKQIMKYNETFTPYRSENYKKFNGSWISDGYYDYLWDAQGRQSGSKQYRPDGTLYNESTTTYGGDGQRSVYTDKQYNTDGTTNSFSTTTYLWWPNGNIKSESRASEYNNGGVMTPSDTEVTNYSQTHSYVALNKTQTPETPSPYNPGRHTVYLINAQEKHTGYITYFGTSATDPVEITGTYVEPTYDNYNRESQTKRFDTTTALLREEFNMTYEKVNGNWRTLTRQEDYDPTAYYTDNYTVYTYFHGQATSSEIKYAGLDSLGPKLNERIYEKFTDTYGYVSSRVLRSNNFDGSGVLTGYSIFEYVSPSSSWETLKEKVYSAAGVYLGYYDNNPTYRTWHPL